MKVLYLSNKEVPYRTAFFNQLARHVDLTVTYDTRHSGNRDSEWATSEKRAPGLKVVYLPHSKMTRLGSLHRLLKPYMGGGIVVVGCVNTFTGVSAIAICRMLGIPYLINLDGEIFLGSGAKSALKKAILSGATGYLTAGHAAARSIAGIVGDAPVFPYSFSSLSASEIKQNKSRRNKTGLPDLNSPVLVVGQYEEYKGLDIALEAARADRSISYIFVGMGSRTAQFVSRFNITESDSNITVIPFLQKKELTDMYLRSSMLLLPSRQECWGLVVNEAASLGTPIVSTRGSGSAVEFLETDYPQFLVAPGNSPALLEAVRNVRCMSKGDLRRYSDFLTKRGSQFSIDQSVAEHIAAFESLAGTKNHDFKPNSTICRL